MLHEVHQPGATIDLSSELLWETKVKIKIKILKKSLFHDNNDHTICFTLNNFIARHNLEVTTAFRRPTEALRRSASRASPLNKSQTQ